MKRLASRLCLLPALLAAACAWAQPDEVQAERAHIAAERGRIAQRVAAEQRACHQRFAVNDCLKASRAVERKELDALRRREVVLNDQDRQRKATEQRAKLQDKRDAQQADQATRETVPAAAPNQPPQPAGGRLPASPVPRAPDAEQVQKYEETMRRKHERNVQDNARRAEHAARAAEETQRYEARQREAADYKARIEQRNAAKPSTAQPLPAP
ncbi:hypothetical protein [Pseudorhodoferax sp. Leaf267]|uniref:hypothetical protein n=1 Tax=Pseudorhodoferax sp. Leaf267 TaxID=1736316 RepID=UPI0006F7FEDA|nr:hypothetical protein [Pseudorhodoferax sp. Leaf267]KQP22984.1 hypothetical protein ASF43_03600 [Pseudorhodoferax sp. Leaf267]